MTEPRIDGHEAYRDDADYTAPEMQPGKGEDLHPRHAPEAGIAGIAALSIGSAGGALAGEVLAEQAEEDAAVMPPAAEDEI